MPGVIAGGIILAIIFVIYLALGTYKNPITGKREHWID